MKRKSPFKILFKTENDSCVMHILLSIHREEVFPAFDNYNIDKTPH